MVRLCIVVIAVLCTISPLAQAQEPAKKNLLPTYSITCKVNRSYLGPDEQGRLALVNSTTTLPEIIAVEASKAEYISERKVLAGIFQFRLQAQVARVSEEKVRIEVTTEDVSSEGDLEKPVIHKHSLQSTRQMNLGGKLKLELMGKNERGESIWVELTVKEYRETE